MNQESSKKAKLPNQIADRLIAQIFTGELKPGDRLPPERQLAADLDVDRTSLRMALLVLERMSLVSVVQGSGIFVRDIEKHAGIDLLDVVFSMEELVSDPSLLAQVIDWANVMFPVILGLAAQRATPEGLRRQEAIYLQMIEHKDDLDRAVDLAVQAQDHIASSLGNIVVILTFNSARGLRRKLLRMILQAIDPALYAESQLAAVRGLIAGTVTPEEVEAMYKTQLPMLTGGLRAKLFSDTDESIASDGTSASPGGDADAPGEDR